MHDDYINANPVRLPALVWPDVGREGWQALHEQADLRGRPPRLQVLALLRWALWRQLQGDDTELTRAQLNELLGSSTSLALDPAAA